jgi:hypothetical protein
VPPQASARRATPGELARLLEPYADPEQPGRLVDVPTSVGREALGLLPADLGHARLNLTQPPMVGLLALAEQLEGRLVGSLARGRLFARLDGIQVAVAAARELAKRVAATWPARGEVPAALESAVAEGWPGWTATGPSWEGIGPDLLAPPLPSEVKVVGLWWD